MKRMASALLLSTLFASSLASAEIGIYAKAGTLGAGGGLGIGLRESLNVRVGANAFSYSKDIEETDINYDGDLEWKSGELLLDWHPFGGSFRVTAGAYLNRNEISAKGEPSAGTYTIDDTVYSAAEVGSLRGEIDFKSVSPYIGIGWGNVVGRDGRFSFVADIGALHQGSPNVKVTAVCGSGIGAARCAQLQSDVDAEVRQLEQDIDDFEWWPVISIGLGYRF